MNARSLIFAPKQVSKINATCAESHARPHPFPMASQAHHEMDAPKELCAPRNVVPQEGENVSTRLVKSHLAVVYAKFLARFENSPWGINYGHLPRLWCFAEASKNAAKKQGVFVAFRTILRHCSLIPAFSGNFFLFFRSGTEVFPDWQCALPLLRSPGFRRMRRGMEGERGG